MKSFFRSTPRRRSRTGASQNSADGAAESVANDVAERRHQRRPLRTARCVLTDNDRYFLVVHAGAGRNRRPRWGLPGGHIDHGEGPETAVCRELYEELELHVPTVHFVDDYRYKGNWHRIYTAPCASAIERFDRDELLDIGWFELEEVVELADRGALHAGYEVDVVRRLAESEGLRQAI